MKTLIKTLIKQPATAIILAALLPVAATASNGENDTRRIVAAGNGVTEIIYALGAGDRVIAVDSTSIYPQEVNKLPKLGYHKQMSAEGILALNPSILIGTDDMGPPSTIKQLQSAGVAVESIPLDNSADSIQDRIEILAELLDRKEEGEKLWHGIKQSLQQAEALQASSRKKTRVLFMLTIGGRSPMVSGNNTAAHSMIELAGGENVAAVSFSGYKSLSNEALLQLAPEVIIFPVSGPDMSAEKLMQQMPILKQTPAARTGKILEIEGTLLLGGLGPRTGETALKLAKAFYDKETRNES